MFLGRLVKLRISLVTCVVVTHVGGREATQSDLGIVVSKQYSQHCLIPDPSVDAERYSGAVLSPWNCESVCRSMSFMAYNGVYNRLSAVSSLEATTTGNTGTSKACITPTVDNAVITPYRAYWSVGETAKFLCNFRYSLCRSDIDTNLTCLPGRHWTEPRGKCHKCHWKMRHTTRAKTISLSCSAQTDARIKIHGIVTVIKHDALILVNLKGGFGTLSHSIRPLAGTFRLDLKNNSRRTNKWTTVKTVNYNLRTDEPGVFDLHFRLLNKTMEVMLCQQVMTRYNVQNNITIDRITVSGDLVLRWVEVIYPGFSKC